MKNRNQCYVISFFDDVYKNDLAEKIYLYHCDHLMTPLFMTNEEGSVVFQAEYYPFGKIYSSSREIENNLRFPGQYAEQNLQIYYNWHRYYSAKLGRYFMEDYYIFWHDGSNYIYSLSNPIINYDRDGNKVKPVGNVAKELFEKFKRCNRLFKGLAETFENDKRKYEIRLRGNYGCMLSRLTSEGNVVNVPPTWKCEEQLECIFHEIYEEFLIEYAGFPKSQMGYGPANDMAVRMEKKFNYEYCCKCIK